MVQRIIGARGIEIEKIEQISKYRYQGEIRIVRQIDEGVIFQLQA